MVGIPTIAVQSLHCGLGTADSYPKLLNLRDIRMVFECKCDVASENNEGGFAQCTQHYLSNHDIKWE